MRANRGGQHGRGGTGGEGPGGGGPARAGGGPGEEGPGGGKLDGCIMHQVHTSEEKKITPSTPRYLTKISNHK